jgi:hypothetical protein
MQECGLDLLGFESGFCEDSNELSASTKCEELLNELRNS